MKLYYSTGTISMACVVAIEEAQIPCELIEVSFARDVNVKELEAVHPLGRVPVLVLDDGKVLTQSAAIIEYLADIAPKSGLLPPAGTWERRLAESWTLFMASDLQRGFSIAFLGERITERPEGQEEIFKFGQEMIRELLEHLDASLRGRAFLTGDRFAAPDCYLVFFLSSWLEGAEIALDPYPEIVRYMKAATERPGVKRALAREDA